MDAEVPIYTMETEVPIYGKNNYNNNAEERMAEEKAIDDWLPITSSRTAKWWFSAFHSVTAIVGAGVLSLPYAMSQLGWGAGVSFLVLSWVVTLYSLWQMVEMHELVPGKRFDRYHELGQHAFGDKLGLWIVVPAQLVVLIGLNIVYLITGGISLQKFHDLVCQTCHKMRLTYFILIFSSVHFVLSQLPTFNSISGVSLAAAVMSISYSTVAWAASIEKGVQRGVEYGYKSETKAGTVFNFFNALGSIAFAYGGHNVVMEIQATMPSTPHRPSKKPMWKGAVVAYVIVALCYFPVAIIGYWKFGNAVDENILITLQRPRWLIAIANMFVVIHLIGGYQLYAMPVFDMIEAVFTKKLNFKPTWYLRFISRNTYVGKFFYFSSNDTHFGCQFLFFRHDVYDFWFFFSSFHNVYCHHIPFLQCTSWIFWRIWDRSNHIFSSKYHMAYGSQAEDVQFFFFGMLVLHNIWRCVDDCWTNWRAQADYTSS
ncbi:lysine histidine transporter 1-like isoform X2 [Salvia splendens]|uniref:lysine histidine transporter 1-like isoform X2 n=1 Tax=Salvia splendens TaxID=180675 RepID=UPI001C2661B6|nr:lysine histidine transporter 1-like isoform X2 [Salvia splendens]